MNRYSYILFIVLFLMFGCQNSDDIKGRINWQKLYKEYANPKDSLKLLSLQFLKENITDLKSETITFYKQENNNQINLDFRKFKNDTVFLDFLDSKKVTYKTHDIPDITFLSTNDIRNTIENAFKVWNQYPWSKNVSFDNFLNYLLPYKVLDEQPDNWHQALRQRFSEDLEKYNGYYHSGNDSLKRVYEQTNNLYYAFVVNRIDELFTYNPIPQYLTNRPGFNEMSCLRYGDCYGGSYLGVYFLRSIGIPATVDIIPAWGIKNGGHSTEVFLNESGKMIAASEREVIGPAKVFRLMFKRQNQWKDSISKYVDTNNFVLSHLKHNHWKDVTHEHTNSKTIFWKDFLLNNVAPPFAYICVFNYGKWTPIYWGKLNNEKGYTFNNMGFPMLYRLAKPNKDGIRVSGAVHMVDSLGNISKITPSIYSKVSARFNKINTGSESWVKKGKKYDLFYINKTGEWEYLSTNKCQTDSIIDFVNIPDNTIYRLKPHNENHELSRPFTLSYNQQKWW
ncbi:hypothetical protein ACR79M_19295 [Sphingobacterium spiritivorum]|uniref:hypothetical protein n=1 Tax=Sphingobacterium spiritivorum TaxID=258 RepID=UPI003DA34AF0